MAGDSTSSVAHGEMPCPDPSVHEHHHKLSEQASTAALYATQPDRQTDATRESRENPLGPDGKLSSKSAAASLKYARAQDLPSFPINGLAVDSAGKAALLARDYKMKELWQPEASAAGSKAALIAAGKGGKVDLWQPSPSSNSNSAATLAMRNKTLSPKIDYGYTDDGKSKALLAATMSASRGRERATSTPVLVDPAYPDSRNAVANALSAATMSHRASVRSPDGWDSEANQAARIKNLGNRMDKAMFGERPPVEPEVEEAKYNAALRASAVSMAKQMYDYQAQKEASAAAAAVDMAGGTAGAEAAARNVPATTQTDIKEEAMRYIHLQDAAHKLAAERLAKVDKNMEAERYREYYGYGNEGRSSRISKRLSMRSGRKRASSEGTADFDDSDDEEQARRIRTQMSQLHTGVNTIDTRKQQDDRARLLAAAEKRVSARMQDMDSRVFAETGKVSPAMMEEWEAKARKRAQEERDLQSANPGKTHIGGGKFMSQAEIEAIAAARLKPTLDEINDTAEKRRQRDEELRFEKEEQERIKREEKAKQREEKEEQRAKNREEKDEQRRIKTEEKAVAKQEKEEEKARKDEEKARKNEEKRLAKEEKRKSRDVKRDEEKDAAAAAAGGAALAEVADKVKDDQEDPAATEAVQKHRSALGRLRDRFRKDHDDGDEELDAERPQTGHSGRAVAVAAAGGAATAVVAEQPEDENRDAEVPASTTSQPLDIEQNVVEATPAGVRATPAVPDTVSVEEPDPAIVTISAVVQPQQGPTAEELIAAAAETSRTVDDEPDNRKEPELPHAPLDRDYATATGTGAAAITAPVVASGSLDETITEERQAPEQDLVSPAPAVGVATTADTAVPVAAAPIIVEDFANDEPADVAPIADPTRPAFEQQPSLSGYYNDTFPTLASTEKPDLERHISQIPEYDEDEDDSDDGEAIKWATRNALLERRLTRDRDGDDVPSSVREDIGEPAISVRESQTTAEPIETAADRGEVIEPAGVLVPTQASSAPAAMFIEKNDPALGLLGIGATGSGGIRTFRSKERIDDLVFEQQERDEQPIAFSEPVQPLVPTNKEAEKSLSTYPEAIGREPAHPDEPVTTSSAKTNDESGTASQSNQLRAGSTTTPGVDTAAAEYLRKTDGENVERSQSKKKKAGTFLAGVGTAGLATTEANESSKRETEESVKEKHGFRGFISRITHRNSKSENKLHDEHAVSYDRRAAADKPTSSATTGYAAHRTAPVVTTEVHDASNAVDNVPESPSSYRRGEQGIADADDVSSSGADEDDVARGRGRRGLSRRLGFGGKDKRHLLHKDPPAEIAAAQEHAASSNLVGDRHGNYATDENEQYEEARDHFDESLAPPPAFAGQRKSESPVRETKFQEEL